MPYQRREPKPFKIQKEPKYNAGAPRKDFNEHIVQFRVGVKRKFYNEAQVKINEVLKQFR